jgi:hypothetical protein
MLPGAVSPYCTAQRRRLLRVLGAVYTRGRVRATGATDYTVHERQFGLHRVITASCCRVARHRLVRAPQRYSNWCRLCVVLRTRAPALRRHSANCRLANSTSASRRRTASATTLVRVSVSIWLR